MNCLLRLRIELLSRVESKPKYFHNTAVAVAQGLSNEVGLIALGYSSALDAYWTCANKSKQLPTWLCTKTRQHHEKLQRAAEQHEPPREFPAPADEWMVTGFTAAVAEAKAAAAAGQRKRPCYSSSS